MVRKYHAPSPGVLAPGLDATVTGPSCSSPNVTPPTARRSAGDAEDRRIRRSWLVFSGTLFVLAGVALLRVAVDGARPLDWLMIGVIVVVGFVALRHRLAVGALEVSRRSEAESFARILQGLSRSISPDAIMDAIVEEIGSGTGADHIVVARRRPDARVLEATLVNARTGGPSSTTLFPISDLEDPPDAEDVRAGYRLHDAGVLVAERIGRRARRIYGLKHTLCAPLTTDAGVIGAIVVSQRTADSWPESAQRILTGAAIEASAALSRAYSHREAEARASTDALTGLPNRRYFDEFCALLARRRRADDAIGILMVDIDRFKVLNDTHGHAVGDEVLRAIAGAIAGAVREDDVPARFGGEEFAVLLRNPHLDEAVEVGERIREAVASLDLSRFGVAAASVSVGVAVATVQDQPIVDVIEQADRALYDAKRRGRDRVVAA